MVIPATHDATAASFLLFVIRFHREGTAGVLGSSSLSWMGLGGVSFSGMPRWRTVENTCYKRLHESDLTLRDL